MFASRDSGPKLGADTQKAREITVAAGSLDEVTADSGRDPGESASVPFVVSLADRPRTPAPPIRVRPIPDVRGLPLRAAVHTLHESGFRVQLAERIRRDHRARGRDATPNRIDRAPVPAAMTQFSSRLVREALARRRSPARGSRRNSRDAHAASRMTAVRSTPARCSSPFAGPRGTAMISCRASPTAPARRSSRIRRGRRCRHSS